MLKFSYLRIALLGLGFFGVSGIWSVYNQLVPPILNGFIASAAVIGLIMAVDNILAILLQPWIGVISDGMWTKIGRRMPFVVVGGPAAALLFGLIPFLPTLVSLMGVIIIMNVAMASFRTPVIALMPDITPPEHRTRANGIINMMGGIGSIIAYGMIALLPASDNTTPFIAMAGVLILSVGILYGSINEPRTRISPERTVQEKRRLSESLVLPLRTLKQLFTGHHGSLVYVFFALFAWFFAFNTVETFISLYGKHQLGVPPKVTAGVINFFLITFIAFSYPAGWIAWKIGRKKTILTGLAALTVLFTLMSFSTNITTLKIIMAFAGICWALININSLPLIFDAIDQRDLGKFTGLYYFFSQLSASVAPPVVGQIVDWTSWQAMFIVVPIGSAIAFLLMLKVDMGELRQREFRYEVPDFD